MQWTSDKGIAHTKVLTDTNYHTYKKENKRYEDCSTRRLYRQSR